MLLDDAAFDTAETEEDALFLMSNLFPRDTGLPRTVWISHKGDARHEVRVKVSGAPGDRMRLRDMATMSVRPVPRLLHGKLAPDEERAITAWIKLNEAVIVDHWNGDASSLDLVHRLQRLPA